ncbi:hypothetical protein RYX36_008996 [Vicia faba]
MQFLMSDKESNKLRDSSLTAVSNLQSKDETDTLPSKGLYSDKTKNRTSVFSRLNYSSKGIASENQNDINGKDIAEYHCQYEYDKIEEVTQQIEDGRMTEPFHTPLLIQCTSLVQTKTEHIQSYINMESVQKIQEITVQKQIQIKSV